MKLKSVLVVILMIPILFWSLDSHKDKPPIALKNVHPALVETINEDPTKSVKAVVVQDKEVKNISSFLENSSVKVLEDWRFIHSTVVEGTAADLKKVAMLPGVKLVTTVDNISNAGSTLYDYNHITNAYNYTVRMDKVVSSGFDGSGVTVAVVDSGLSEAARSDFHGRVVQSVEFNSNTNFVADKYGHGSHVAGIIGGDGSNSKGKYVGISPGVNLLNVKISDDNGGASEVDLVNALQWVYENKDKYNIRVANISSTVSTKGSYKTSPAAAAVEQLWNAGIVVVVSAGNRGGEDCSTCYAPANDPYVISVGATNDMGTKDISDDVLPSWSSSGVTLDGHAKPDILAPGSQIVSYMPSGSLRSSKKTNIVDGSYFTMGGTSMAAPVVSGVVAAMLQAHPEWTPDQVKYVLKSSARTIPKTGIEPGVLTADNAVFWKDAVPNIKQAYEPSSFLGEGGKIDYNGMAWNNRMAWNNGMAWSNNFEQ